MHMIEQVIYYLAVTCQWFIHIETDICNMLIANKIINCMKNIQSNQFQGGM